MKDHDQGRGRGRPSITTATAERAMEERKDAAAAAATIHFCTEGHSKGRTASQSVHRSCSLDRVVGMEWIWRRERAR